MVETNTHRRKGQEGFTLIELVVVVAILGVLAAVLTPRVLGAVDNAKEKSASSTAKQLQVSLERYLAENDAYPGACTQADNTTACATLADRQGYLERKLGSYASIDWTSLTTVSYTPTGTPADDYELTATFQGHLMTISPDSASAS